MAAQAISFEKVTPTGRYLVMAPPAVMPVWFMGERMFPVCWKLVIMGVDGMNGLLCVELRPREYSEGLVCCEFSLMSIPLRLERILMGFLVTLRLF